jgi:hypothetical protein
MDTQEPSLMAYDRHRYRKYSSKFLAYDRAQEIGIRERDRRDIRCFLFGRNWDYFVPMPSPKPKRGLLNRFLDFLSGT